MVWWGTGKPVCGEGARGGYLSPGPGAGAGWCRHVREQKPLAHESPPHGVNPSGSQHAAAHVPPAQHVLAAQLVRGASRVAVANGADACAPSAGDPLGSGDSRTSTSGSAAAAAKGEGTWRTDKARRPSRPAAAFARKRVRCSVWRIVARSVTECGASSQGRTGFLIAKALPSYKLTYRRSSFPVPNAHRDSWPPSTSSPARQLRKAGDTTRI